MARRLLVSGNMKTLLASLLLAITVTGSGCTSEDADAREGIYQVSTRLHNADACNTGGESIVGAETFALVTKRKQFGGSALEVFSCASPEDCRQKLARLDAGEGVSAEFIYTEGRMVSTGYSDGSGHCTDADITETTLRVVDGVLQVEQKITVAADYDVDADGFCTTTLAQRAAEGHSCSQHESLSATLAE